eukprot:CAMPEP_0178936462 /NCGR_PEP_ID=MMETSP0786-20121207/25196_1 /TAXON_ID=186022 /ORGANISM="Thalassionema frauenfeldii, Strain CCMP 1798" /LENGTH=255 /DNA_ID=CAMNT_0020614887 /DNA_START=105 /DNA_END=873 /DNA_ORIENTATION=-
MAKCCGKNLSFFYGNFITISITAIVLAFSIMTLAVCDFFTIVGRDITGDTITNITNGEIVFNKPAINFNAFWGIGYNFEFNLLKREAHFSQPCQAYSSVSWWDTTAAQKSGMAFECITVAIVSIAIILQIWMQFIPEGDGRKRLLWRIALCLMTFSWLSNILIFALFNDCHEGGYSNEWVFDNHRIDGTCGWGRGSSLATANVFIIVLGVWSACILSQPPERNDKKEESPADDENIEEAQEEKEEAEGVEVDNVL